MRINQGDIWLIEFEPSVGQEIRKSRPAAVINFNAVGRTGLSIVVPITEWKEYLGKYPWIIKIINDSENGLSKISAIECSQVKSFSQNRFVKKLGNISKDELFLIHQTVLKTFNPIYKIK